MKPQKAILLLVLCNLFWSGNFIVSQFILEEMSPFMLTYLRWLFAVWFLLLLAHIIEKPQWKKAVNGWTLLAGMGITGIIMYNTILYSALMFTSSINASIVTALNPGLLVILSAVLLKEKISGIQISGIIVSLLGVMIVITGGRINQLFSIEYNVGDLLMLLAISVWSIYSILGKKLPKIPPITTTAISSCIAVIIMTPFALLEGLPFGEMSTQTTMGVAYIIIFPSMLSFMFWNIGVRALGAGRTGIFLNLVPVFTALISTILGDPATFVQLTGGIFVFLGVYMTTGMLERKLGRYQKIE